MTKPAWLEFYGSAPGLGKFDAPLFFECVTSEASEQVTNVTQHNVEKGANVTDHIRATPARVTLDIFLSNTPLEDPNDWYGKYVLFDEVDIETLERQTTISPQVVRFSEKINQAQDVVSMLETFRDKGILARVVLPWKTFNSMVVSKITARRTASTGDAVELSLETTEVRLVEAKLVTAPVPTESRGKTAKSMGRQPTSFVRDPGPKQSLLQSQLKPRR